MASGSQRYWSTAVPLPSQVCCAGLVAYMGPKMLTVHYPGMRPREDNSNKMCRMEHYAAAKKHEAAKKYEAALSTLKCVQDVLFRGKKKPRKCRSVCEMSPLMWKNKIHVICLYLQRLFLQESLSSG